jgi:hypothetical protein
MISLLRSCWRNGRLLSIGFAWWEQRGIPADHIFCVHGNQLTQKCSPCERGIVPELYEVIEYA